MSGQLPSCQANTLFLTLQSLPIRGLPVQYGIAWICCPSYGTDARRDMQWF